MRASLTTWILKKASGAGGPAGARFHERAMVTAPLFIPVEPGDTGERTPQALKAARRSSRKRAHAGGGSGCRH